MEECVSANPTHSKFQPVQQLPRSVPTSEVIGLRLGFLPQIQPHLSTSEIGVGMAVVGHPSLRTGLADFPHPALQLVSHPIAAGLVRLARAKAYREISPSFSKNALG